MRKSGWLTPQVAGLFRERADGDWDYFPFGRFGRGYRMRSFDIVDLCDALTRFPDPGPGRYSRNHHPGDNGGRRILLGLRLGCGASSNDRRRAFQLVWDYPGNFLYRRLCAASVARVLRPPATAPVRTACPTQFSIKHQ
jgi:hypothetical protein